MKTLVLVNIPKDKEPFIGFGTVYPDYEKKPWKGKWIGFEEAKYKVIKLPTKKQINSIIQELDIESKQGKILYDLLIQL